MSLLRFTQVEVGLLKFNQIFCTTRVYISQLKWKNHYNKVLTSLPETHKAFCHNRATRDGVSAVQIGSHQSTITFSNACHMFDRLSKSDVVSATSIIAQFVEQQCHEEAIYLFSRILVFDIRPNEFTFGTLLRSSTLVGNVYRGMQLHAFATKIGLNSNVFVGSAQLDLYVKLGTIQQARRAFEDTKHPNVVSYTTLISGYLKKHMFQDARQLFREMPEKNIVSWNAMVGGCSQTGLNEDAVNYFVEMLREGYIPNHSTFPCAVCAAANIASLGMGQSFHASAIKFLGKLDLFVSNSLISFYAKCGSMEDSLLIFNKLSIRTIVSWNAVISGYAQNGRGEEAITFFNRMQTSGFKPNDVSLLALLWACNHAGLVDVGYSYFNQAKFESPHILKVEHYACMVDLLARSGQFREAEGFINDMPFNPGIGFWKALLGGCQIHSNTQLGELAARKILELNPDDVSSYVMLSNAHSAAGDWLSVSSIRRGMKDKGMTRIPGCSWIEIRSKVYVFVTADKSHHAKDDIYMLLRFFLLHSGLTAV